MIITGSSQTRKEEEEENTIIIAHDLSHDIIFFHILTRLPSKSVRRFSCVSKLWYNTIHHDTFFINSHYNHSKLNPSLVVIYGQRFFGTHFMYLDQVEQEEETSSFLMENLDIVAKWVVGSINGLTCIHTDHFIVICNPGTHEILRIPYPDHPEQEFFYSSIYGFGFDPLMNVYKVLRINCNDDSVCQIFSLGAGAQDCIWRDVNVTNDVPLTEWQAEDCEYPFNYSSGALFKAIPLSNIIIMFDIQYEKFQVIPGLQVSRDRFDHFHLYSMCEFRGCPYAVYRADNLLGDGDGYEFSLYALKKTKSSSSNSNVGSTHFVFEHAVRIPFKPWAISISFIESSGKMLLQWMEVGVPNLCVYNQHTERLQEVAIDFLQGAPLLVVKHIDSLLSLKTLVPPSTLSLKSTGCRHLRSDSFQDMS